MQLSPTKPLKALKGLIKQPTDKAKRKAFKENLIELLERSNESESEEHHKNLIRDFLTKTYYDPDYHINTKGRNDLVIHNGKAAKDSVGVIIEAKKPTNKAEMPTVDNINTKALHELILYFFRERFGEKEGDKENLEIKHLIITNVHEWFVFDAQTFEKLFAQNKKLVKDFKSFREGTLSGKDTGFFYNSIAKPFVEKLEAEVPFIHLDLGDYDQILKGQAKHGANKLTALYKLFTPEHLLKLPYANDSNTLDKRFYAELLHIIGLSEVKDKGKKVIQRSDAKSRNEGSLLENAIGRLRSKDALSQLVKPSQYGDNIEEQLFNVGLELVITWVNRILFLKLLEAQLIAYHKGDKAYAFLSLDKVEDYDELDSLFFEVLAIKGKDRESDVSAFAHVPYLNSSLFEPTDIEKKTIYIGNLKGNRTLPVHGATVLKESQGKKATGEMNTLAYLFAFLEAYDFGAETQAEDDDEAHQEQPEASKTLINASVLGLIFEKINGYKDGSFFTPGFITMYMCRETIRRSVVQKFNETKGWNCKDFGELKEDLTEAIKDGNRKEERKAANQIVNSLKICDPAVGSGHFLVSALNEIIAIKHELRILTDRQGDRLSDYSFEVVNDELTVTDDDREQLFEYIAGNKESLRVQETLFHEKQTIIENCLFGVDINPNSVKICRLRLWIELLKNAYYKGENELETLPNIDINIKCGNSLISRFALDADLKQALKKSKWDVSTYRTAVSSYRNAQSKEEKRDMMRLINDIKSDFRTEIAKNDPKLKKLYKLGGELQALLTQTAMFQSDKEQKANAKRQKELEKDIEKLTHQVEEIKSNKIYENAFEWRFEFPEVLDSKGDFLGFDTVIGNPPYMRVQEIQKTQPKEKLHYEVTFQNAKAAYDLANLFFELAVNIASNKAHNSFIFPHKFLNSAASSDFRNYLMEGKFIDKIAHFGANMIFEDADTYTCVAEFSPEENEGFAFQRFAFKSDFQLLMLDKERYAWLTYSMLKKSSEYYGSNQWIAFDSVIGFSVFEKIYTNSNKLESLLSGIYQGLATSNDKLYILEKQDNGEFTVPLTGKSYKLEPNLFKPFLMGKMVQRYSSLSTKKHVFFPYQIKDGEASITALEEIKAKFPLTYRYLQDHEKQFKARESGKAGKMKHWHAYIYPKNLNRFEQPKLSSMEICSKHPNVILNNTGLYHPTTAYSWVKNENTKESYEYLLAIANSKVLWWFLKITGDTLQGDARRMKTNYLNPFPIPKDVPQDQENEIKEKAIDVLALKKTDPKADTAGLEGEIDQLVYQLYDLTAEEIKIVEGSVK